VLVVVIVASIIVVITAITVSDESKKPATPRAVPKRGPAIATDGPAWDERIPAFPTSAFPTAVTTAEPMERVAPTWAERLRAAGLLGVTVVLLGSLAAGAVGAVLYLGYQALDRALG
jgi:hypothetical protein